MGGGRSFWYPGQDSNHDDEGFRGVGSNYDGSTIHKSKDNRPFRDGGKSPERTQFPVPKAASETEHAAVAKCAQGTFHGIAAIRFHKQQAG